MTHVHAVVHDATVRPDPEIRAIARLDIFVDATPIFKHLPLVRCFVTAADETTADSVSCTPMSLASTIWAPRPPAILLVWDSAVWDWFTPALSRGIARVDLGKIARLIWPEGPAHDLLKMADHVVSGNPKHVTSGARENGLQSEIRPWPTFFW